MSSWPRIATRVGRRGLAGGNFWGVPERRVTPRTDVALPCVLRRRSGSAIDARTVNLGAGGMCIATPRPLATDEVLEFDLLLSGADRVDGRARVLRQEGHDAYALRFEGLLEPARERLGALASAQPLN
jgi:PilZ domain-containing protein